MKYLMHTQHARELSNPSSKNGIMKGKKKKHQTLETGNKILLKLYLIPVMWLLSVTV